jgi:hypothetical protein
MIETAKPARLVMHSHQFCNISSALSALPKLAGSIVNPVTTLIGTL